MTIIYIIGYALLGSIIVRIGGGVWETVEEHLDNYANYPEWILQLGITLLILSCSILTTIHTILFNTMFLQVTDRKSSMLNALKVDAGQSQAIVEYNDGSKYLYNDVDFSAIYELLYRNTDSLGQWVINNLKVDSVQCVKLWYSH